MTLHYDYHNYSTTPAIEPSILNLLLYNVALANYLFSRRKLQHAQHFVAISPIGATNKHK